PPVRPETGELPSSPEIARERCVPPSHRSFSWRNPLHELVFSGEASARGFVMAAAHRAYWRGYLKLALVTCPVLSSAPRTELSTRARSAQAAHPAWAGWVESLAVRRTRCAPVEETAKQSH